jgi:hypothetical protein
MKRWSVLARCEVENPKIDAFIEEVIAVCKKHKLSISHEDGHGAFQIDDFDERDAEWLREAHDITFSEN